MMILPGPTSETAKPCRIARSIALREGMNIKALSPACHGWYPRNSGKQP